MRGDKGTPPIAHPWNHWSTRVSFKILKCRINWYFLYECSFCNDDLKLFSQHAMNACLPLHLCDLIVSSTFLLLPTLYCPFSGHASNKQKVFPHLVYEIFEINFVKIVKALRTTSSIIKLRFSLLLDRLLKVIFYSCRGLRKDQRQLFQPTRVS